MLFFHFGGDEDVFPAYAALQNACADRLFISVGFGGIEKTIPRTDRGYHFIGVAVVDHAVLRCDFCKGIGSGTDRRDSDAV